MHKLYVTILLSSFWTHFYCIHNDVLSYSWCFLTPHLTSVKFALKFFCKILMFINMYLVCLEGLKGFQHKMSVTLKAEAMSTLALPLVSRVNLQPYLLVQTNDSVRVLQAVLWGDPFLEPNLTCSFDQLLRFGDLL